MMHPLNTRGLILILRNGSESMNLRAFASICCLVLIPQLAQSQDMPLTQVLIDGEEWELLAEGFRFTEGPAVSKTGNVFFTDPPNNSIHWIGLDGKVSLVTDQSGRTSGLMMGPDERLYGCSREARQIVAWTTDGTKSVIANVPDCNDLVVSSSGAIWFTDPSSQQVRYISPDGKQSVVAEGFRPNGITLWPDESTLVVTDSDEPHLWTFRVEKDGTLSHKDRYYMPLQIPGGKKKPGSDGMTVDKDFRLYVATHAGIQMFDPTGRLGGTIAKPQRKFLSNICFGGLGLNYLYATTADKVYRRKVKPTGAPYILKDNVIR